jgi:adenylosuccinate synthase
MKLFRDYGAHVLVDGQFGSTGKGALASYLALRAFEDGYISEFAGVITNAGPNSGHTSYFGQNKIVLKQLPTFAVHAHLMGKTIPVYLSAGAVIDPVALRAEASKYPGLPIFVHPNAAIVTQDDRDVESQGSIHDIASTMSGTGAAQVRKIWRRPEAIARMSLGPMPHNVALQIHNIKPNKSSYFVEVAQGFSLGINSEFYPHVTSRECTVMQAIADARIAPRWVKMTYMCIRTFPIRVGNLDEHSSGDWYDDQYEVSWEEIGVEPERTTVTNRIRRVATFSTNQFWDAVRVNDPDVVAINFMNYLTPEHQEMLIANIIDVRSSVDKRFEILVSHGPKATDWKPHV